MTGRLLTQGQCDRLKRLCEIHPISVAAQLVGVSTSAVGDARARGWLAVDHRRMRRPRPADFAIQAQHLSFKELCQHYRAGERQVRRWRDEIGVGRRKPSATRPTMPAPDGSAAAVARYGLIAGTPTGLRRIVERHGASRAAELYGVSYGTLRLWRKRLGLPFSWSRQPGARRGRTIASRPAIGWVDSYRQSAAHG